MIIGYYGQIFFGGGTYYKLSKKENEDKFKFEYIHTIVPNYISNAEEYIKKYETLEIEGIKKKEHFVGENKVAYFETDPIIKEILYIVKNSNWDNISQKKYDSEDLDNENWDFYIEYETENNYFIKGYAVHPEEIEKIYSLLKKIKEGLNIQIEHNCPLRNTAITDDECFETVMAINDLNAKSFCESIKNKYPNCEEVCKNCKYNKER